MPASRSTHRRAHADRRVRASEGEDGMGHLGITATIDQVRIVDHRLTLAARQLRRDEIRDLHLAQDREFQWEHGTLLAGAAVST